MYLKVTAKVKHEGQLSREVVERQGIRQGSDTSTEAFKSRCDGMIDLISAQPDALHIGIIPAGAPTCADDTCIMSTSMFGTQALINIAEYDSRCNRYEFSSTKTRIMHYQYKNVEPLNINNNEIAGTTLETHLGLQRTSDGKII